MNTHETETLQPLTNADLPPGLSWTPGMVDKFFDGYLQCALWSSMDESDESGGEPLDSNYGPEDIPVAVRRALRAECLEFIAEVDGPDMDAYLDELNEVHAGHDFWLTRNGHGAGFWDHGMGEVGDKLSEKAQGWGVVDLYVGDDGRVWASGYESGSRVRVTA